VPAAELGLRPPLGVEAAPLAPVQAAPVPVRVLPVSGQPVSTSPADRPDRRGQGRAASPSKRLAMERGPVRRAAPYHATNPVSRRAALSVQAFRPASQSVELLRQWR